jgi:molecular chaperone GrpE
MSDKIKKNTEDNTEDFDVEQSTEAAPSDNSPVGDSEVDVLRHQLEEKELEAKNNYDRFVRQTAELDNFKKRSARDREEAVRYANESLIKDLLPVVDNLERAVAHASGGGNGKPIVEGVELVLKGLLDVLAKHGVAQISAVGQPFDPAKHEAITQVESQTHEPNSVVDELHKGYTMRDRLLRPALVSVAKPPITQEKKNDDGKVENDPSDD